MLKLGENLKKLRTENGLTQEQLADVFGISPQAVSRWENNCAYPDITLLPAIANYFDITTDELLGVDIEKRQQEINKILEHNKALHSQGKNTESISFLREKIILYPKNEEIPYQLALSLYCGLCADKAKTRETQDEIINLINKATQLDKGRSYVTYAGKQLLCMVYEMQDKRDEAYKIAVDMPSLWCSREVMLTHALQGETEINQRQHNLLTFMDLSINNLHHLSCKMDNHEKSIILLKKAVQLADLLAGDNPKFYSERVFKCYMKISENYCALGKLDEAMENLELALKYAEMFENRPEKSEYTAFWLKGYFDDKTKATANTEVTLYSYLLTKISEDSFSILHNTNEYSDFFKRVRQKMEQ